MIKTGKKLEHLEKSKKYHKLIFLQRQKYYSLSFPILGGRHWTRALQSSPFQNPGGDPLSLTEEEEDGRSPDGKLCV